MRRFALSLVLVAAIGLIGLVAGCASLSEPGRSPDELKAQYSSNQYVDRDFNDVQPLVP